MTVHMLSAAPLPIHVQSVGLNLGGKQSGRGVVLCARSGRMLGLSRKVHVETWAGGCQSLNLSMSQEQEIGRRCAVVGFPPRNPCVTPVLPGPGSDTRMKMGWKILGSVFSRMPQVCGCCGLGLEGVLPHCVAVPCGSSCSCSYSYGRGPAVGPYTGERCWPLVASVWRAIAPLMKPWCAEGEVPTAANLNLYR